MFFHVTRDGRPVRKRRYAYSEAFAAIAWAAHFRATGRTSSAQRARELFDHFTRWNFTPGLMPPKFTDFRPMIGLAPRMITLVTAQELREDLGESAEWTTGSIGPSVRSNVCSSSMTCAWSWSLSRPMGPLWTIATVER